MNLSNVCEECQRVEHTSYCSRSMGHEEPEDTEISPRVNCEGLTYSEWAAAARQTHFSDESIMAWTAGEDPTEWNR